MGVESKIRGLRKKSTVHLPVLCGSGVPCFSTWTLIGSVPQFVWEVMAKQGRA